MRIVDWRALMAITQIKMASDCGKKSTVGKEWPWMSRHPWITHEVPVI